MAEDIEQNEAVEDVDVAATASFGDNAEASGSGTCERGVAAVAVSTSAAVSERETRPDDVAEAAMFAAAGGHALDVESIDHGCSHVGRCGEGVDGELQGVSLVCRSAEPPTTVTLHGGDDTLPARLLDRTLMKLDGLETRAVRIAAEAALADSLWQRTNWLSGLPDLTDAGRSRRWEDRLAGCSADVIDVVQRALARAEAALRATQAEANEAEPSVPVADGLA